MVIIGHRYSIYVTLQQLLLLLICRIASSNGESVWNQLHDHTKTAHIKAQQRKSQSASNGDTVHEYPNLFTTTKDAKLEPVITAVRSQQDDDDDVNDDDSTTTTKARKGDGKMMMMSMKSDPITNSPVSVPTSSPTISTDGKGGGMMMMSSSTASPAPSTSGKGGMMKSTSLPKTSSPSTTIVPSYSPTTSNDDNNNKNGKGKGLPKVTKSPIPSENVTKSPIPSKKVSKSPTPPSKKSSKSPTVSGKGKGKKGDEIVPTSSPTVTATPSVTAVPTFGGIMGMMTGGMMMGSKDGMGMSSSSSSSPIQAPPPGMKKGKGGMDGMSKSKITPPPTSIPSLLPTPQPFPSIPTAPTQPSNRVQLSPYTLQYTFIQSRVPFTFEVEEVVMITRLYLADYFEIRYPDIMEFITNITGSAFTLQRPFTINYTSTAIFNTMRRRILNVDDDNDDNDDVSNNDDGVSEDDDSGKEIVIPPVEELDIVLTAAFTGANLETYVNLLADLPPENIFRNTTAVTFAIEEVTGDSTTNASNTTNTTDSDNGRDSYQGRSAKIPGGIAAGVTGAVMIVAFSIMIARHRKINHPSHQTRRSHQYNDTIQKRNPNSDDVDDEAHMTVAGDTCVADSTVVSGGNASLLSSNYGRRRLFTRRILSQSREVVTHSQDEAQLLASPPQSPDLSNSDLAIVSVRRGISDILRDRDSNDCSFNDDDDYDTHDEDDRSLLPFYCTSPESAYRGALSEDVHDKRSTDLLLTEHHKRDDMKLPRHYNGQQEFDDIPNAMHHDIDEYNNHDDDDDDTLSVDDDVPLRVIDLIRKFTPTKKQRRKSR